MTDRELLELAAKAACLRLEWNGDSSIEVFERWCGNPSEPPEQDYRGWNPLDNDADALRLAVALRIDLLFFPGLGEIRAEDGDGNSATVEWDGQYEGCSARVREAFVRCAAAIGRSMP